MNWTTGAWKILRRGFAVLGALALFAATAWAQPVKPTVIAAATDLKPALGEIAKAFQTETGQKVTLIYSASGDFAQEIAQTTPPYQIFLSADENYVKDLANAKRTKDEGAVYAIGRIALIVPKGSPLKPDGSLADLKASLGDERLVQFAIPNPADAPYGKAAEAALRHQKIWDQIEPKVTLGYSATRAAQMATSKNFEGGITAYSLALAPQFAELGSSALIPNEWHPPIRQRMVLLKNAGPVAEQFYAYLQKPEAREVFARHGFEAPGESP